MSGDLYDRIKEEFNCGHETYAVVYKDTHNAGRWYYLQCQRCGEHRRRVSANEAKGVARPLDEQLQRRWNERRSARYSEAYHAARRSENDAWWASYEQYLRSQAWASRREAVLRRDNWTCQACLNAKASQAHHTTYKHVGNEPLFELVSVCVPCHDKLTLMDREARA